MKTTWKRRLFAVLICVALLLTCFPVSAFADAPRELSITEGDVIAGFADAGASFTSSDPSVAWVDENGSLNALRTGTATITDGSSEYSVTVGDYTDGTEVVGNLKLLARYNDSMQFYDGHVYLLFTSYQDGVEISVPDLYAGYDISPYYYTDINNDISIGSNHTGNDSESYFKLNDDMDSVTLDRGEIVTIGMYRDFDLSVAQAALGVVENSSAWKGLTDAAKAAVIETVFMYLSTGNVDTGESLDKIKAVVNEAGLDYTRLFDGVTDGGVCFNRELYNQKLEWDQYENVTYELDITKGQLEALTSSLKGNLNVFSIINNSCATVAVKAWNAAVGTRDGKNTSYYLTTKAGGIFDFLDAPKGVRDNIVKRLPGYCLNNKDGVAEPDAGFEDETGWVYVSAPEKVEPLSFEYADDSMKIYEYINTADSLFKLAKAGQDMIYNKDHQEVDVEVKRGDGVINAVDFTVNGMTFTLNGDNMPKDGIWFCMSAEPPAEGESYIVTGADGKALASVYDEEEGLIFRAETLPQSFSVSVTADARNILSVQNQIPDAADIEAEVYYYKGGVKTAVDRFAEVPAGAEVFVKTVIGENEESHMINSISLNGDELFNEEHYNAEEGAYCGVMPAEFAELVITGIRVEISPAKGIFPQIFVGDTLDVDDCVNLVVPGEDGYLADCLEWNVFFNDDNAVSINGRELTAEKEDVVIATANVKGNKNIECAFVVEIFESRDDVAAITYDEKFDNDFYVGTEYGGLLVPVPYSGYFVKKGTEISVTPKNTEAKAVLYMYCNGAPLAAGESYTVNEDTMITAGLTDAEIVGMPGKISLADEEDTYTLNAEVKYKGIASLLPVYDKSVNYIPSDPLIDVDDNGVITVNGEIPEDGAKVFVTAFAGSSNGRVTATTEVTLGDYKGDRIVGSVTVYARTIAETNPMPHGSVCFTTYEDIDLDVSYYVYSKPNDKYKSLMLDYQNNPESYKSDPAVYNDNELGLTDRESYFDQDIRGAMSEPVAISLKSGESITVSYYSFDSYNSTIVKALENSDISAYPAAQTFIDQMHKYNEGEETDTSAAFDSMIAMLSEINRINRETGKNPANGHSDGGLAVDRELYNQFRFNYPQTPNNYYTVEITADELANLRAYLADPANNYYSLNTMNCASGAIEFWNHIISDRPELKITGNFTGFAADPESMYAEIGRLALIDSLKDLYGHGGRDFYLRSVAHPMSYRAIADAIDALGEPEPTDEFKARLDELRKAYEHLSDTEKSFVTNIDELTEAEEAYEELRYGKMIEDFEDYKAEKIAEAESMLEEGDSLISKALVALAKAAVRAAQFDKEKTPEENRTDIDAVISSLPGALAAQRLIEHPLLGDVNYSGEVDVIDAALIQRELAGIETPLPYNDRLADVDKDGFVSLVDVTIIQRWLANADSVEGIGEPVR